MAGDWIKVRTNLRDDPAVIAIAAATGLEEDHVVGKLVRIWSWANEQTLDGHAAGVTEEWIDRYLAYTGFAAAMRRAGWLKCSVNGIDFPKFDSHNSQTAKRRAVDAIRKFRGRSAKCHDAKRTPGAQEKRREEKKQESPLPTFPASLNTERFKAVWAEWAKHRAEKRNALKPTTIKSQLKLLERLGEELAIRCIEYSIAQGYMGLFPERVNGANGSGSVGPSGRVHAQSGKYDGIGIRCGPEAESNATKTPPGPNAQNGRADHPLFASDDPQAGER